MHYGLHDVRHKFISRLAENPRASEQTIKALAGHLGRQMRERYCHVRSRAMQAVIHALEQPSIESVLTEQEHKYGDSDPWAHHLMGSPVPNNYQIMPREARFVTRKEELSGKTSV